MPTSSVGRTTNRGESGVTLLELLVVVLIIAVMAGLTYPSINAGLDSLRLRSASNAIVGFLNTAFNRAERREQVVEITIVPNTNTLTARSIDGGYHPLLELPDHIHVLRVLPDLGSTPDQPRRFLLYPGGTVPGIGIELENSTGRRRMVTVDPITGTPRADTEQQ